MTIKEGMSKEEWASMQEVRSLFIDKITESYQKFGWQKTYNALHDVVAMMILNESRMSEKPLDEILNDSFLTLKINANLMRERAEKI